MMKYFKPLYVMCMLALTITFSTQAQYIYSMAGSEDFGDGEQAIDGFFLEPRDAFADNDGNVLVVDASAHVIRKIDKATGIIKTIVGNGEKGDSGDGGLAVEASLSSPADLYIDGQGNIYIADAGNNKIRRVDALTGIIETVAGNGNAEFSGDGGQAIEAGLWYPHSVFLDKEGNIFLSDMFNRRIRKVAAGTGIIETVAGNGDEGFSEDGGPAINASMSTAQEIHVDNLGNIYFADFLNHVIRKVDGSTGIIETIAGNGFNEPVQDGVLATETAIPYPFGVSLDNDGNIYISTSSGKRIRKIDHDTGIIQTVAGNGENGFSEDGSLAVNASIRSSRCHVDINGNLYIPDSRLVRKVDAATGIIETLAGGNIKDSYLSHQARLNNPGVVVVDKNGDVYFTDNGNGVIRKVDAATGLIATIAGDGGSGFSGEGGLATKASFGLVSDIFVKNGDIYIADLGAQRLLKVDATSGNINTIAGKPGPDSSPDDGGLAVNTSIGNITSVFVDDDANIYFSVDFPSQIRKIDGETNLVETIAGTQTASFSGDGGPATEATLDGPNDIYVDKAGNIYISDEWNGRIRRIDAKTRIIETVAGNGTYGFSDDGGPAVEASLWNPSCVVVDDMGNIFITDPIRDLIRRVDAQTGIIQTIAGNGNEDLSGDRGLAVEAGLSPSSLSLTASGTSLFIADQGNNRIRMVTMGDTFHAAITSEESSATDEPKFNITLSFNRIAPGFKADDLTLLNAVAGELSTSDNENYVVSITPKEPGLVEVVLEADKLQDLAGNSNVASNAFSIQYTSEVTGITNQKLSESLEIYPVPAGNNITIELNASHFSSVAQVRVFNLLGKAVSTATMKNAVANIPLKNVKPGVYLVKVVLDEYSVSKLITVDH